MQAGGLHFSADRGGKLLAQAVAVVEIVHQPGAGQQAADFHLGPIICAGSVIAVHQIMRAIDQMAGCRRRFFDQRYCAVLVVPSQCVVAYGSRNQHVADVLLRVVHAESDAHRNHRPRGEISDNGVYRLLRQVRPLPADGVQHA